MKIYYLALCLFTFIAISCSKIDVKSEAVRQLKGYGMESRFIEIDGRQVHYTVSGSGEPIVLIHGWSAWNGYWNKQVPDLSKKYRVYAVDLYGHGLSHRFADESERYTIATQSDMVIKFLEKLSIKNACLVGHSMGGHISVRVASKAGDRIRKLVLVSSAGLKEHEEKAPLVMRIAMALRFDIMLKYFAPRPAVWLMAKFFMYYRDNPVNPQLVDDVSLLTLYDFERRSAFARVTRDALFNDSVNDAAPGLKMPTFLIWGKEDIVIPVELGVIYNKLIPESKLHVIEKAGHMVFDEKPEEFNRVLIRFLDEK
jgi:pimeloyl-ACP methyl ester carboxylesterase